MTSRSPFVCDQTRSAFPALYQVSTQCGVAPSLSHQSRDISFPLLVSVVEHLPAHYPPIIAPLPALQLVNNITSRLTMLEIYLDPCTVNSRKVLAGLDLLGTEYHLNHVRSLETRTGPSPC